MTTEPVFHRPKYAADMAQQLLKPSALQVQVRSGVFLSASAASERPHSFGKT